ncbi:MAG: gamma-glutamylcyclotransferase family protein [Opitutaceae bacterium]
MKTRTLVFVYGTLKRGCSNQAYLAGQEFVGEACTPPGFQLYELNGYPGMIAEDTPTAQGVSGEIWSVDAPALLQLDQLEGLAEGLYRRQRVPLLPPFHDHSVEAYLYARTVADRPKIGSTWKE